MPADGNNGRFDPQPPEDATLSRQDVAALLRELEQHQAELEQQNDDLRRVQQELIAARDRYRAFYNQAPVGYLVLSQDGTIRLANQAAELLCGTSREVLTERPFRAIAVPKDSEHCDRLLQSVGQEVLPRPQEFRLARQDGEEMWIQAHVSQLVREGSGPNGLLVTLTNITNRQAAATDQHEREIQLCELNQSLDKRVAERTSELETLTTHLRDLAGQLTAAEHRERKRLAAILHDELQQFLVAARMQLGRLRTKEQDEERFVQTTEMLDDCLQRAIEVSRSLTQQLRPPVLYEGGLIPALQWLVGEMEKRHELHVQLQTEQTELMLGDDISIFFFECVRELLFNVVKHAGTQQAQIQIDLADQQLEVTVADSGEGFDPAAKMNNLGAGAGLFSMRERMTALGGELRIETAPRQGARITLSLPLEEATKEMHEVHEIPPNAQWPEGRSRKDGLHVLVVDDRAIVRQGIASMLAEEDCIAAVEQACDGIDALEHIQNMHPDVVMIDVHMPRLNGVETTREVRERWPDIGIVGLSVADDEETVKLMLAAGAESFLAKTDDATKMLTAIIKAAGNRLRH